MLFGVSRAQTAAQFNTWGTTAQTGYADRSSTSGWKATNAALIKISSISDALAPTLNGKVGSAGVLTSPEFDGGIGTLEFKYQNTFSETKGVKVRIDIKQNGNVVDTETLTNSSNSGEFTYTSKQFNKAGKFSIVITNLSPSNSSSSNKDRVSIYSVEWTNYSDDGDDTNPSPEVGEELTATFNFKEKDYNLGNRGQNDDTSYIANATTISEGKVSLLLSGSSGWRIWTNGLRAYNSKNPTFTFSVPKDYVITEMSWTGASTNFKVDDSNTNIGLGNTWTGEVSSIKFVYTGTDKKDVETVSIKYKYIGSTSEPTIVTPVLTWMHNGNSVNGEKITVKQNETNLPTLSSSIEGLEFNYTYNNSIVSIDESGNISIVGVGETEIKATSVQVEGEYASATASFILNVVSNDYVVKGTEENPYLVSELDEVDVDAEVWVRGFVIGTIVNSKLDYGVTSNTVATNLALALENDKDALYIPVELPSGKIRNDLNLKDNPGYFGADIAIKGKKQKYFGQDNAIKGVSEYIIYSTEEPKFTTVALSFPETSYRVEMNAVDGFNLPAVAVSSSSTFDESEVKALIRYKAEPNGTIAAVSEDGKSVSFNLASEGTVTITAYLEENDKYKADEASFNLTVYDPSQEVEATEIWSNSETGIATSTTTTAPTEDVKATSKKTNIEYTFNQSGVQAGNYLYLIGGKGYVEWSMPDNDLITLKITTGSGNGNSSTNKITVYAGGVALTDGNNILINEKSKTYTIEIPAEYQKAGTVYKVANTGSGNSQIASFTYVMTPSNSIEVTVGDFNQDKPVWNHDGVDFSGFISYDATQAENVNLTVKVTPKFDTKSIPSGEWSAENEDINEHFWNQGMAIKDALETSNVDGYYGEENLVVKTNEWNVNKEEHNLFIQFPCSGLYEIKVSSSNADVKFKGEATQEVSIYPSIKNQYSYTLDEQKFENDGITINGVPVEDINGSALEMRFPVIEGELWTGKDVDKLENSILIIPGLYLANVYYYYDGMPKAKKPAMKANALADESVLDKCNLVDYDGKMDLSGVSTTNNTTLELYIEKNGVLAGLDENGNAHPDYTLLIVPDTEKTTPTGVEAIGAEEGDAEYFTLQGVKVQNPEKGIFIKVTNGNAVKVVL